jgi:guanylate kinase
MTRGPLVVLSGPSGSGKTTVVDRLLATTRLPLRRAVTATTRPERPGEQDGVHYHFWTPQRFQEAIDHGELLEWAVVHGRDYYGTPRDEVEPVREQGKGVILIIDVQGAARIRELYPGDHLSVFLWTTEEEYERRLRQRGETEESIRRRLATARDELARRGEFDRTIRNDDLTTAVADLEEAIRAYAPAWP